MPLPSKFQDLEKMLGDLRKDYRFGELCFEDLSPDPFDQFSRWLLEAIREKDAKADVMVLGTSADNRVSTRCVLLKGFSEKGLVFYTNTRSRKARQIARNPKASACFYWASLERQVTVMGPVKTVSRKEAEIYFQTRPPNAQIAAWCSEQSKVLKSREELERRFEEMKKKFEGIPVPFPEFWSGFRIQPNEFEFWQGRANRLNDRFRYQQTATGWRIERLSP